MPTKADLQRSQPEPEPQQTTIYVVQETDEENNPVLVVDAPGNFDLESMGVLEQFSPELLPVMQARALAHGYTVERRVD